MNPDGVQSTLAAAKETVDDLKAVSERQGYKVHVDRRQNAIMLRCSRSATIAAKCASAKKRASAKASLARAAATAAGEVLARPRTGKSRVRRGDCSGQPLMTLRGERHTLVTAACNGMAKRFVFVEKCNSRLEPLGKAASNDYTSSTVDSDDDHGETVLSRVRVFYLFYRVRLSSYFATNWACTPPMQVSCCPSKQQ
jgi:hypothetical protein